jgi:hypothetical protein
MLHRLRSDLSRRRFGVVVCDESHALRSHAGREPAQTATALAFIRSAPSTSHRHRRDYARTHARAHTHARALTLSLFKSGVKQV